MVAQKTDAALFLRKGHHHQARYGLSFYATSCVVWKMLGQEKAERELKQKRVIQEE